MNNQPFRNLASDLSLDEEREDRLVAVMEEYRAALERGQPIDTKEFLQRHSDLAEDLADCLAGMELIQNAARQIEQSGKGTDSLSDRSNDTLMPLATLGDFKIVRELGRGGMGVVYEAEQLSLGRTVALKVLPFAAMLDDKQLQRFKNEARSAATLNHPNIVPVYFVGTERGVHFYAMQLVEGQSLAEMIASTKHETDNSKNESETFRSETEPIAQLSTAYSTNPKRYFQSVAEIGCKIADALGSAHERGIIHRDVKPANILIDKEGNPWVHRFWTRPRGHRDNCYYQWRFVGYATVYESRAGQR